MSRGWTCESTPIALHLEPRRVGIVAASVARQQGNSADSGIMERDVEDKHGRRAAHGDAPRSAGQQAAEPRYRKPFKPDKERILEAILFLIGRTSGLSQHEIVKSLFLADRAHLNTYGRPI